MPRLATATGPRDPRKDGAPNRSSRAWYSRRRRQYTGPESDRSVLPALASRSHESSRARPLRVDVRLSLCAAADDVVVDVVDAVSLHHLGLTPRRGRYKEEVPSTARYVRLLAVGVVTTLWSYEHSLLVLRTFTPSRRFYAGPECGQCQDACCPRWFYYFPIWDGTDINVILRFTRDSPQC